MNEIGLRSHDSDKQLVTCHKSPRQSWHLLGDQLARTGGANEKWDRLVGFPICYEPGRCAPYAVFCRLHGSCSMVSSYSVLRSRYEINAADNRVRLRPHGLELAKLVATGLWPVSTSAASHSRQDGPQGRGYSGHLAYSSRHLNRWKNFFDL